MVVFRQPQTRMPSIPEKRVREHDGCFESINYDTPVISSLHFMARGGTQTTYKTTRTAQQARDSSDPNLDLDLPAPAIS